MLVVAEVLIHGLIDSSGIARGKILDVECKGLFVLLCELWLLWVKHTCNARRQYIVFLDIDG